MSKTIAVGLDLAKKVFGRVVLDTQARVLEVFSGSGAASRDVMRLNRQDGGRRQCISVTDGEVAADEQAALRKAGLRPGDPEREQRGICNFITNSLIVAAIAGKTPEVKDIEGDCTFTDECPMADGFEENAEFVTDTCETHVAISANFAMPLARRCARTRPGARRLAHAMEGTRQGFASSVHDPDLGQGLHLFEDRLGAAYHAGPGGTILRRKIPRPHPDETADISLHGFGAAVWRGRNAGCCLHAGNRGARVPSTGRGPR